MGVNVARSCRRWRDQAFGDLLAAAVLAALLTLDSSAQEAMPVHADGKVLTAQEPFSQTKAHFGYTMAAGRIGLLDDTHDDVVACAVDETVNGVSGVGSAYLFTDEVLVHDPVAGRLLPKPDSQGSYNEGMEMGILDAAVANIRGSNPSNGQAYTNLILIGCWKRDVEAGGPRLAGAGSVEVFDIHRSDSSGTAQLSLVAPPLLGPQPACQPRVDNKVKGFGHALAIGDVDQDGIDDLMVGAPYTDTGTQSPNMTDGRIYVLLGHPDFLGDAPPAPATAPPYVPDPYKAWVGFNAPTPSNPERFAGSAFGDALDALDLDADGSAEIVAGRTDRYQNASPQEPQGGRVDILRGSYVKAQFSGAAYDPCANPSGTWDRVLDLAHTDEVAQQAVPEYQELTNPFGSYNDGENDWFGRTVGGIGDIGSPGGGPPDGFPDIAVHAEGTNFIGNGTPEAPQIHNAGGLFIYFGVDPQDPALSPQYLVHPGVPEQFPPYALLQRPVYVLPPLGQENGRVGRAFAGIDWYDSLSGEVEHALMYSEPDADWGGFQRAGVVYLVRPPLCASPPCRDPYDESWELRPLQAPNVWSAPLTEPFGDPASPQSEPITVPSDAHEFGSWIVALDYKANPTLYKGQQVVISSRQADVKQPADHQGVSTDEAGAAFPFVPAPPGSP